MPSRSDKQKKFFTLVKAVQQGKVSPKKVGPKIARAASSISKEDVEDFLKEYVISPCRINEMIVKISSLISESEQDLSTDSDLNPIAKTFNQQGDFEGYVGRFSGLELKPKELESISNYNTKPTKIDKFSIRYESTDDFNNNTVTVIKKLRDGNDLVFTVFQSLTQQNNSDTEKSEKSDIIVNKSHSFKTDIEGGKLLSDILEKLGI